MNADLYKRLFKAIFSEDVASLKKLPILLFQAKEKKTQSAS